MVGSFRTTAAAPFLLGCARTRRRTKGPRPRRLAETSGRGVVCGLGGMRPKDPALLPSQDTQARRDSTWSRPFQGQRDLGGWPGAASRASSVVGPDVRAWIARWLRRPPGRVLQPRQCRLGGDACLAGHAARLAILLSIGVPSSHGLFRRCSLTRAQCTDADHHGLTLLCPNRPSGQTDQSAWRTDPHDGASELRDIHRL